MFQTKHLGHLCLVLVSCFVLRASCFLFAAASDTDSIRQKQQAQETARSLAGDLISAVLDVQLRQLEENGLKSLPVYRDIASMKANIADLVDTDMSAVVDLLIEAQDGTPQQRLTKVNAARTKIRDVVVQLMAERQKLYRRLQMTRLSAEAQQLVALQSAVHESTGDLPQRRAEERERAVLEIIEDQADVLKLYYQLVASISDVSTWGGASAAGAADGLRILRAAQVEPELRQAGQSLSKTDFSQAAEHQRAVLKGLRALLDKLEETQGLTDGDREAALRLVRELIARQNDLREQTGATELSPRTAEPLIEQQTRLQKDLSKLAATVTKFAGAEPLIEQAKAASFEATASLFDEKSAPALDKQGQVVAQLVQIERLLLEGLNRELANKSAAELAAEVARLTELKIQLGSAENKQFEATQAVDADSQLTARRVRDVNEILARSKEIGEFTAAIDSRLEDAQTKVTAAAQSLGQILADEALTAIRTVQAEVAAELADTRRRHKAVEVGELARAAEALERTAAAEGEIARVAVEASGSAGLSARQAIYLNAEQADVSAVAARIAEGVADLAPKATELLQQAMPSISAAAGAIEEAVSQAAEQSKSSAARAGLEAGKVAPQLIAAAAALRVEQVRAARELEAIAGEQLTAADNTRQAVENAIEGAKQLAPESLEQLEHARQLIAGALIEQSRADGRPEQASAEELQQKISVLVHKQQDADQAAGDLARGRAINPLLAATQQQEVAEQTAELATQSPADLGQILHQAARSAAAAARETLAGNAAKATAGREQTRTAMVAALEAAQQASHRAAESPPGPPDNAAQAVVREKVAVVEKRKSTAALLQAKQSAVGALKLLESGSLDQARGAQAEARRSLVSAANEIEDEIRALAAEQEEQLSKQARQADVLSAQAREIDPGAAASLAQAHKLSLSPTRTAANDAQAKLSDAAASLAARQQQLRHDRDLAQSLADLAQEQQAARDAISKAVQQLQEQMPGETNAKQNASEQIAAAQALNQAQQEFAAAQTATGEGAADVSGQQEVANQPIREGLQIASRLGVRGQETGDKGQETVTRSQEPGASNQDPAQADPNGKPGSKNQNAKSSDLGTKLVPASPETTAKQIAGPQASAAAAAMAEALKNLAKGQQGEGQGESDNPQEGSPSPTAKKGGAAKSGKTAKNQAPKKGELETEAAADADSRGELVNQDTTAGGLKLEGEAWFAKLPPELRTAIQAKSRGKAPRGYEERLRRYFDGVD